MNIELVEATENDRGLLGNLAQLYAYDFSEFDHFDVQASGRFVEADVIVLPSEHRRSFLIHVDGRPAGFAMVGKRSSLTQATDVHDMNEFFVMRKYRRLGVGRTIARRLFDSFPGKWEVRQVASNVVAQAFWRQIIGEYMNGNYEERLVPGRRAPGPAQFFVSHGGGSP